MMRLTENDELSHPARLADWIAAQLDSGLDWFDHADIYGDRRCETLFGEALARQPALRSKVRLISKADIVTAARDGSRWGVKHYDTSAAYLRQSVEGSLRRLGVERLDLFLIHRPDPLMDVDETAQLLDDLVAEGKLAAVGVSNFLPDQWRLLQSRLTQPLRCNQIELSLKRTEPLFDGQAEALQLDRMQALCWSPLAGGTLEQGELAQPLAAMADIYGCTPTALAMAWLRRIPGAPVPVLGSFNAARIAAARQGCELSLTRSDWFTLLQAARGHRVA
ncbi:aldo/keto reductase [Marinobacterium sp. CAU 1594]|nr:aldo/keto reductase [Marinobacterium arenosum]